MGREFKVNAKIKNYRKKIIQIKPPKMIIDQTISASFEDKCLLHSDQVVSIGDTRYFICRQ